MSRGTSCIFPECRVKRAQFLSLFSFPNDISRCKEWLIACNREDLICKPLEEFRSYKVCERHFEDRYMTKGARKTLFKNAVPSLNLRVQSVKDPLELTDLLEADQADDSTSTEIIQLETPVIRVEPLERFNQAVADKLTKSPSAENSSSNPRSILMAALQNSSCADAPLYQPLILRQVPPLKGNILQQIKQLSANQAVIMKNLSFPQKVNILGSLGSNTLVASKLCTQAPQTIDLTLSDDETESRLANDKQTGDGNTPRGNYRISVNMKRTPTAPAATYNRNEAPLVKKVVFKQTGRPAANEVIINTPDDNNRCSDDEIIYVPIRDYCAFINCSTHIKNISIRKYRFPLDNNLLIQWKEAAGVPDRIDNNDLKPLFVCDHHFTGAHYTDNRKLKASCVPQEHGLYVDKKAVPANPHWLRKQRCTRKKYPIKSVIPQNVGNDFVPEPALVMSTYPTKLLTQKCCVKHCQADETTMPLFKFPSYVNEHRLWVKAVENRADVRQDVVNCYKFKQICSKHFEKKFLMKDHLLRPDAIPTLDMGYENDTATANDADIVWEEYTAKLVNHSYAHAKNHVKRKAILLENSIEFPNLKRRLKFGKGCPKIGLNKFPYNIYRLPYNHDPKPENINEGHKLQIHTAIVIDDDDQSEKAAVDMICDIIRQNELPNRRRRLR